MYTKAAIHLNACATPCSCIDVGLDHRTFRHCDEVVLEVYPLHLLDTFPKLRELRSL